MQTTVKTRKATPGKIIRLAEKVSKDIEKVSKDMIKKQQTEMEARERQFLKTCRELFNEDKGCTTPFHDFFGKLVRAAQYGQWPTPEDVRQDLEEFEMNFQDMRRDAKMFLCRYPEPAEEKDGRADLKLAA